jgi:two-component system response regulator YesN
MYRILVADDEALEREGMRWIISNMMQQQFTVIEAENGREALQQASIHKPHIVVMDIRMPGMDGLTALRAIQQLLPQTKFVLVTAYESFDYAQEAVRLGAKDYIVKPAKRQDIVALIERLIGQIQQEKQELSAQEENEQRLNKLVPLVKSELALRLIASAVDEQEILNMSDSLEITPTLLCAIVVALPNGEQHSKLLEQQIQKLQQQLKHRNYQEVNSPFINEHIVLFVIHDEQHAAQALLDYASTLSKQLLTNCMAAVPQQVIHIGIGNVHEGITGARRSYYEAVFASTSVMESGQLCLFQQIEHLHPQPQLIHKGEQYAYVQQAISLIQQEREQQTFSIIDAAIHHIERFYQRELSLEDVAEHVHLNPYYFSKVFKQQTGETFIDYITRIRIKKAKQWMNNKELSLKEICHLVGYNDPNYFSRVFKKVTGVTPSAYRGTLEAVGNTDT